MHQVYRVLWWAVTLRLPLHSYYWVRARRARNRGVTRPPAVVMGMPPTASHIHLPRAARPTVSIIIPTYGQTACTLYCIAAIAAHPPLAQIDVIVVDDASGDPTVAQLNQVDGIRLIRLQLNLGFVHTCSATAKLASGEYLLFLNNDTRPCVGWLDAMLALAVAPPNAGAVGAKLIYPDGQLQEAGGIICNDGTGWNYGRGDDPAKPEILLRSRGGLLLRRGLAGAPGIVRFPGWLRSAVRTGLFRGFRSCLPAA
ncbi:MAG TPA: glycosyltransferase [Acetobacteraceae bacterium]|jgi:glycosyltransferase involved in cell wall biosynthesis|nr:glycosyltransferase [Acetobacteraceae bacterium]